MHAGVKSELVEFFMGHTGGIKWVYDDRNEVHPDDLVEAYPKMEPYVSLHPDRVVAGEEFASRERDLRSEIDCLRFLYDEPKRELLSWQSGRPSPRGGA